MLAASIASGCGSERRQRTDRDPGEYTQRMITAFPLRR
jgi:hypothetical protein